MQASDIYVVQRNEENVFEVALEKNDRLVNFYDSLLAWSLDESVYLWSFGDRNNESVILDFLNGRSAFTLAALGTDFLEATFDVGVLPLPKYSEAQEITATSTGATTLWCPAPSGIRKWSATCWN